MRLPEKEELLALGVVKTRLTGHATAQYDKERFGRVGAPLHVVDGSCEERNGGGVRVVSALYAQPLPLRISM